MAGIIAQTEFGARQESEAAKARAQLDHERERLAALPARIEGLELPSWRARFYLDEVERAMRITRLAEKRAAVDALESKVAGLEADAEDARIDAMLGPDGAAQFARADAEHLAGLGASERVKAGQPGAVRGRRRAFAEKRAQQDHQTQPVPAEAPSPELGGPAVEHAADAGTGGDPQPIAPIEAPRETATPASMADTGAVDPIIREAERARIATALSARGIPATEANVVATWRRLHHQEVAK